MHGSGQKIARSILRNSAALLVVGLFSKAMGLVIAVMVARFLGPSPMGLFAFLYSIALLTENVAALGLQDVLLRDVAASPRQRRALWRRAALVAVSSGLACSCGYLVAAYMNPDDPALRSSLVALAVGMPFATLFGVSQALMQGMEEVLHLLWMTFIARIASLIWLAFALSQGAGIEAAFISRVLFQIVAAAMFAYVILRSASGEMHEPVKGGLLASALPLAANRLLAELSNRAPVIMMPGLLGLTTTGLYDAADRFRQTLGMAVSVGLTAVMPSLSRGFDGADAGTGALVAQSIKYTTLFIGVVAIALNVFAGVLIHLLYGAKFAESVLLMQVLSWAHVLLAADAMVKQAMVAGRRERAVPLRSLIGTTVLALLVWGLSRPLGAVGVALAVALAAGLTLLLDLRFTVRNVIEFNVWTVLGKPLLCLGATAAVLFALLDAPLWLRLAAAAATFLGTAAATRLLPAGERSFLWTTLTNRRPRAASMSAGQG